MAGLIVPLLAGGVVIGTVAAVVSAMNTPAPPQVATAPAPLSASAPISTDKKGLIAKELSAAATATATQLLQASSLIGMSSTNTSPSRGGTSTSPGGTSGFRSGPLEGFKSGSNGWTGSSREEFRSSPSPIVEAFQTSPKKRLEGFQSVMDVMQGLSNSDPSAGYGTYKLNDLTIAGNNIIKGLDLIDAVMTNTYTPSASDKDKIRSITGLNLTDDQLNSIGKDPEVRAAMLNSFKGALGNLNLAGIKDLYTKTYRFPKSDGSMPAANDIYLGHIVDSAGKNVATYLTPADMAQIKNKTLDWTTKNPYRFFQGTQTVFKNLGVSDSATNVNRYANITFKYLFWILQLPDPSFNWLD